MDLLRKLEILADAAKYDASCASSGAVRRDSRGSEGVGSAGGAGICHSYTPDAKALHEVWSGMLEHDPARCFARVHLLLNRASTVLDVESHMRHEGNVVLRVKQTSRLAVRIPRWVDKSRVECATGARPLAFSWLGNYVMLPEVKRGQSVAIRFPMTEITETVDLAWCQTIR